MFKYQSTQVVDVQHQIFSDVLNHYLPKAIEEGLSADKIKENLKLISGVSWEAWQEFRREAL
jgi:hypothetical protein